MNNDRLKFRVWDKNNKRYIYFDFFSYLESRITETGRILDIHYSSCNDNLIDTVYSLKEFDNIEQCTALRDKNDNLIYANDLIKVNGFAWPLVVKQDKSGLWETYNSDGLKCLTLAQAILLRGAEIVGNTHKG